MATMSDIEAEGQSQKVRSARLGRQSPKAVMNSCTADFVGISMLLEAYC